MGGQHAADGLDGGLQRVALGEGGGGQLGHIDGGSQRTDLVCGQRVEDGQPLLLVNHLEALQVGPGGGEGAVSHPQVLHPQEGLQHRFAGQQDVEGLLHQLFVGHVAHRGEHGKEDRHGDQHGPAARHGAGAFLLVQLGQLALELFLVMAVLLLKLSLLGGQGAHLAHALAGLVIQRKQAHFDQQRERHQRPAVAGDQHVDAVQNGFEEIIHPGLPPILFSW